MDVKNWPENVVYEIWRMIRRFSIIMDFQTVAEVLGYTVQKCAAIHRDANYLPVLFENEINDHILRQQVNAKGGANYGILAENPAATA